ncbi:MAG: hypothetical protein JW889_14140 [Verrucomicrobia bacterium]|nr:hypothetical protein [Verrucomicrobiota bacterium]
MRYVIAWWLVAAVFAAPWAGAGEAACPQVPDHGYPALVFVRGTDEASTLCMACVEGGEVHTAEVVAARPGQVRQLDDAIFLAYGGFGAEVRLYAIDLAKGRMKPVEPSELLCSVPERRKAMLLHRHIQAGTFDLIELELDTLETKPAQTVTREKLGDEFGSLLHGSMKLSPDFRHLAYAVVNGDLPGIHEPAVYSIKVLDLSTMKSTVVDGGVQVRIGMFSSMAHGRPAFEWLGDDEIVYQHIPGEGDGLEAEHVLKIADIKKGTTREVMRPMIRMTFDGGGLDRDPVSGRIAYNREHVLDLEHKALLGRDYPFSVEQARNPDRTTVRRGDTVVFDGPGWCVGTCLSPSGKHFAFMIQIPRHPKRGGPLTIIYAVFAGRREAVAVSEKPEYPAFLAWVEKPNAQDDAEDTE